MATRPCIVIPGIPGSSREDFYPLSPDTTWSAESVVKSKVIASDFDALALDADVERGLRRDPNRRCVVGSAQSDEIAPVSEIVR
jgi:hypothetical protein